MEWLVVASRQLRCSSAMYTMKNRENPYLMQEFLSHSCLSNHLCVIRDGSTLTTDANAKDGAR